MVTIEIQGQFSTGTTDMCGTLLRQNITQKGHMQGSSHTASYPLRNHKALCTCIYLQGKRGDTWGLQQSFISHVCITLFYFTSMAMGVCKGERSVQTI